MPGLYDNDRVHSLSSDVIAEAWRLQAAGIDAVNTGRPGEGAELLRRGLALVGWREGEDYRGDTDSRTIVARLLNSLALAESQLGDTREGLRLLDVAWRFVAAADTGVLLNQRGLILWRSGDYLAALDCFAEAEPYLRRYGPMTILIGMLLNRGGLHSELGRYSRARRDLDECVPLAEQHGLQLLSAKALHWRGIVERGMGDVPAALALLSRAGELYRTCAPDMAPELAISIADALRQSGLVQEAAARLDQAVEAFERQGRHLNLIVCEFNRAWVARESGDLETAAYFASRAETRARKQGSTSLADWPAWVRREAEFRMGPVSAGFARETLELSQRQRRQRQEDADLAELLAARAFVAAGMLSEAERILARGHRTSGDHILTAKLTRQLARAELQHARGNRSKALAALREGLTALHRNRENFGSLEMQAGVTTLGSELAELGLDLALQSNRASTVFSWSERSRAQAYRLPSVHPPEDRETAELLAQVRSLHDSLREAELTGTADPEERARCRKLERQLRERSWQTDGPGRSVAEVTPTQIRRTLAESGEGLVSFLHHAGQLHAVTLLDGTMRHYPLGAMAEVDEYVRRLLADLNVLTGRKLPARMAATVETSIRRQVDQLDAALFSEFASRLGDRELVVVPTNVLSSLPWGLLPRLRGRPVTVAPSAAAWCTAKRRPETDSGSVLLASGPDLAHAGAELDAIAEHHYDCVQLRGAAATPAAVLSALDGAPVAHLAAHGYHESDNVLFSRLDFASGPLMAYDIARLDAPPSHVTLSACDVGRAQVTVGDETLGFTAALLYAGTRTVVSSVAKVEHEAAAEVMTAYHAELVAGRPPAQALAAAAARRPFSPFVCYGAS